MDSKKLALIAAGIIVVLGGWLLLSGNDDATGALDTGAEVSEPATSD